MVQDGTLAAGVGISVTADTAGIFQGEAPAARSWHCQHCGTLIVGKVLATYNGGPLCLGDRERPELVNCYRLVSMFNHQMPCQADPCPGEKYLDHVHADGEAEH